MDSSPEYVHQAIDKSLKRLGVSHIDLYYCHRLDGVTPVEETVKAMYADPNLLLGFGQLIQTQARC